MLEDRLNRVSCPQASMKRSSHTLPEYPTLFPTSSPMAPYLFHGCLVLRSRRRVCETLLNQLGRQIRPRDLVVLRWACH